MFDQELAKRAAGNLVAVRERRPLIHNITNYVVMNYTANALLACGASPVMAHAGEEVEEMVSLAGALVINIGTLSGPWIESMIKAAKRANQLDVPVILDPVGAGATALRTRTSRRFLEEVSTTVIRGNASEVLSLAEKGRGTKGVDSIHTVEEAADAAVALSRNVKRTLAITGKVDLVTDGERVLRVFNGHEMMGRVTGTGCTATAIIGAFLAVDRDPVEATATALAYFGLAGEKAAAQSSAPGSFQIALLDALYTIDGKQLEEEQKSMGSDEWGKDPAVQTTRKIFKQMELAQGELLEAAGISIWDPRLRRWREVSLAAFERAWANAAGRGIELREDQAGALYAHCLARTMMREGIEASDARQSDETIQRLVEEVFY